MKDIADLTVKETRLFRADDIPFRNLITASNLNKILKPFIFKNVDLMENTNKTIVSLQMKTGEFKFENKVFPIEYLCIESSRIIFILRANSDISKNFYKEIEKLLIDIDQQKLFAKSKPLIKTVETFCTVTLDISYKDIFSKKMIGFIEKEALKECSLAIGKIANIQIVPSNISFDVKYVASGTSLTAIGATIGTKKLTIEPREGVNINEKRFFTASPTDSKVHLKLLSEVEKSLKKAR